MWRTWRTTDAQRKGFTLIEVVISLLLLALLMTATAYALNPVLLAWSSHQDRMGLQRQIQHGMERALRDLRLSVALQNDASDAVRFTLRESGTNNSYILYLYNASDTSYQLRRAALSDGIGGTFTYGSGTLLMREVKPPPSSELSVSDSVATLDLTVARGDETIRLLGRAKRRNP